MLIRHNQKLSIFWGAVLRILILHNFYQKSGGEDLVVEMEAALLRRAGHDVSVETVSNDSIVSVWDKSRLFFTSSYNHSRYSWAKILLEREAPDIVHVHNFFPLLSTAVHRASAEAGAAVVQTLHNYRLLCAAATFLRDGKVCELCLNGSRLNALKNRCYRQSLPGTAALVRMQRTNIPKGPLINSVDRYIALTSFARDKFIQGGLPPSRLVVKPNFVEDVGCRQVEDRTGALFVGRISAEKGVQLLVEAWKLIPNVPLRILGEGPLLSDLKKVAPANVKFLGFADRDEVRREMFRAKMLIVPSLWYEGFPMTIVEAFSCGLPVIASNIGSLSEIIDSGRNGVLFQPGDVNHLVGTVQQSLSSGLSLELMGARAREDFCRLYSSETNLSQLESIYAEALRHRHHKIV